jgi:sirohydrochlorin cobaltochelatase
MKKGIIITSFGTTHEDTRKKCIESVEDRIKERFEDFLVLRAFTSKVIMKILKNRDNIHIDTVSQALVKMAEAGIKDICIQPLLIIEGVEYEKILREARNFLKDNDCNIKIGKPLLSSEEDYKDLISALDLNKEEATVFMGHGTYHKSDVVYQKLEDLIRETGNETTFIGTVEGAKTIEDIVEKLKADNIDKVILKPLMLVAGDHAKNDMASDEDDSWKSILESNGIQTTTLIEGLGENERVQDLFMAHLQDMM